jgi:signal transduction histidine kinase
VRVPALITRAIDIPRDLPQVSGGAQQLVEIFVNLIQNAVDAMPEGGTLLIGGECVQREGQRWVVIWVHDTGVGIAEGDLKKIFQRSYGRKEHGLGFGLWWTQTYLERLDGQVMVESQLGKQTRFTVMLPAFTPEA